MRPGRVLRALPAVLLELVCWLLFTPIPVWLQLAALLALGLAVAARAAGIL